ncbi:MAG TPA: response regulator [Candidatus Eisenbacteria bacterium]|jgi:CheY-like chemotaxis protein
MVFQILYIEDDSFDARLMQEAMSASSIPHELTIVSDGAGGLARIRAGARAVPPWRPDIVMCDLHMPGMGGHDFLRAIKADTSLRQVPIIILSSSESDSEIALCYELHANCVVRKPSSFEQLRTTVQRLTDFWLATVVMPRQGVHL